MLGKLLRWRAGGAVKRYHTFPTIGNQSVGEHSHAVALILLALNPDCSKELLVAAMHHDLAEFDTGDVPANVKWAHPEMTSYLEKLEHKVEKAIGATYVVNEEERKWLKLADTLEYCLYALEQRRLGNQNMDIVFNRGMTRLESYDLAQTYQVNTFISRLREEYHNAQMGIPPETLSIRKEDLA